MLTNITTPKEFFGFTPGDDYELARWDKIVDYLYLLEGQSDRIVVENMGPSTEGHPFLKVTISSPANLKNLDRLKEISMKLSDPRGMEKDEIEKLVCEGRAVCVQSMSLHGNEVGGTQMSVNLIYELVSGEGEETLGILDEVVSVIVPCLNPDGQIQAVDWYYENKGTEFEGCDAPEIFHKYAGHDNNRDSIYQNVVESRYMMDILLHEWMPQAYQDHHHMGCYGARMEIAPFKDPIRQDTAPHIWRELNWYGAYLGRAMEEKGLTGVSNGSVYPGWLHTGFHSIANQHNIAGLLTETSTAKMATPKYIDPTMIKGNGYSKEAHTNYPSPWNGGWWHLHDITDRQYTAAYALFDAMARNRKTVLRDMAIKANYQTECGKARGEVAYIIPEAQHDTGEVKHLIHLLLRQNIEVHRAKSAFSVGYVTYPAGTYVVFLAQPKYGVITNILGQTRFPVNRWTKDPTTGAVGGYDVFTDTINEYMGVEAIPANAKFEAELEKIKSVEKYVFDDSEKGDKYILSGRENSAFRTVNKLLGAGVDVYRADNEHHDFYVEGDADVIASVLCEYPTPCTRVDAAPAILKKIEKLNIGVFHRYYYGNDHEGWTRYVLEDFGFDYRSTYDVDIKGGLEGIDVLVMPHEALAFIIGLEEAPAYSIDGWINWITEFGGPQPPKYRSGIGMAGVAELNKFVERGGRMLAISTSAVFAIDYLGLKVRNVVKGLMPVKHNTHGSTLRVTVDPTDPICYGMPKDTYLMNVNDPTFALTDKFDADNYTTAMKYKSGDLLRSGYLAGEEYIVDKATLISCKKGKGEVVLYGYEPVWRGQTRGMYKTFFNKLYR